MCALSSQWTLFSCVLSLCPACPACTANWKRQRKKKKRNRFFFVFYAVIEIRIIYLGFFFLLVGLFFCYGYVWVDRKKSKLEVCGDGAMAIYLYGFSRFLFRFQSISSDYYNIICLVRLFFSFELHTASLRSSLVLRRDRNWNRSTLFWLLFRLDIYKEAYNLCNGISVNRNSRHE